MWATSVSNPKAGVTERTAISENINIKTINDTIKAQSNSNQNARQRQRQREHKLMIEKSRGFPVPPIFVLSGSHNANVEMKVTTARPFYEGQINYYLETKDENEDGNGDGDEFGEELNANDSQSGNSKIASAERTWYKRVSPMLRNGLRRSDGHRTETNNNHMHQDAHNPRQEHYQHKYRQQQQQQQTTNRYHHKHRSMPHQHTHHFSHALHHRHHHHHAHNEPQPQQQQPEQQNAQEQPQHVEKFVENSHTQTPYPPPAYKHATPTIGHQITDLEDFQRYYAKWPHLARVQFQVYDEHMREANAHEESEDEEYPEYEYGSLAEMEEAQHAKAEDANLPPYIRKYNRRNKQLLDLLEGPLPPPKGYHWSGSKLQPGPVESSDNADVIRLDDDYMREKRRRHHLLHGNSNIYNVLYNNLFAQQRKNDSMQLMQSNSTEIIELSASNNVLPDDLANLSEENLKQKGHLQKEMATESNSHVNKIIGNEQQMSWQIEKLLMPFSTTTTTTTTPTTTPKALVFRLPSFNGNYAGHTMRQRSRSAHFATSPGQRRHVSGLLDSMELHGFEDDGEASSNIGGGGGGSLTDIIEKPAATTTSTTTTTTTTTTMAPPTPKPTVPRPKMPTMPPRSISAFVYHRVVDNSPRQVGAGGAVQGRKQQLPFVAITDRRLETFKKSLLERQKEFEQNNFPPLP